MLTVVEAGALTTVQDRGRVGLAHLGVPRAGALDRPAADLANRLVGNPADAAVLEVMLGGFVGAVLRRAAGSWSPVRPCPVTVDGESRRARPGGVGAAGRRAAAGPARDRGAVLRRGRRAASTSSRCSAPGPPTPSPGSGRTGCEDGAELPIGAPAGEPQPHDTPRPRPTGPLRISPGPRDDWFDGDAVDRLCAAPYAVTADSNRIGLRLEGAELSRTQDGELASEGMVLGSVQVPPSGQPVVFLADHPPTGGYPVIGVVRAEDLWQCAQLRPGDEVRFTRDPQAPADATR